MRPAPKALTIVQASGTKSKYPPQPSSLRDSHNNQSRRRKRIGHSRPTPKMPILSTNSSQIPTLGPGKIKPTCLLIFEILQPTFLQSILGISMGQQMLRKDHRANLFQTDRLKEESQDQPLSHLRVPNLEEKRLEGQNGFLG